MKNDVIEIHSCEVCSNDKLVSVLDLGFHPMCDDLVPVGDDRKCKEYPIEILFCEVCLTAHQRFQVPKHDLFPKSYHYRSRFTLDVLKGMEGLVESCEDKFGSLTGKSVLDIGCNDGSLLDYFRKKGATTVGIEPTEACSDAKEKGHITFNEFLSEAVAESISNLHGQPDFITFTNVFAHIENLNEVIRALKKLASPKTVIVIENHYLGSVLDGNQFDTFYHEHPRTYSYTSFTYMAESLGGSLLGVEFPSRYGGNIRIFIGFSTKASAVDPSFDREALVAREKKFMNNFSSLREKINLWLVSKKGIVNSLFKQYGKLRAKAFPGRAAILVKLLGLDENLISAVYEKPGSLKIGHFLPGTRIPIHSDDELIAFSDKTLPILNLAWHIPNEIRAYLTQNGYTGQIIDILDERDFISTK
ncbi:methyltransferase domain-containing protein [Leptospira sp. 201903071]|uniref:class I SAM-dependent methyltransferase n=1 Tax=Leptospira ainazelensis TaxID=2810034 RepID=UPI001964AEFE|nr:class I SAM-dependent methyltransferase [Leptospira ainazelensis]MBM9501968.1 methyltransferase domain-containing protein [Leptospira ainazelensis]